jgi:hypothetical protein
MKGILYRLPANGKQGRSDELLPTPHRRFPLRDGQHQPARTLDIPDLLDVYYDTEKPLPADLDAVCYSVGAKSDEGRRIVKNTPQFDARTALARWAGVDLLAEPCPTQTSIASRSRRLCGWHKPTRCCRSARRRDKGRFRGAPVIVICAFVTGDMTQGVVCLWALRPQLLDPVPALNECQS